MLKADDANVSNALAQLDRALEHPRVLARERIAQFRLDREKENLPVVNAVDSGSPLLDRDATVRASYPNHAQRGEVERWSWQCLLWWR